MSLVRLIARPLLASCFVWSGAERLRKPEESAKAMEPGLRRIAKASPMLADATRNAKLVARVVGAVQVGAGLMLALGRFPRLSASLLVGASALTAAADGTPADGTGRISERLKNLSLAGGVLLASVDTAGQPSIAWRAQHLTADTRKQLHKAGQDLSRTVRRTAAEAKKATGEVIGH